MSAACSANDGVSDNDPGRTKIQIPVSAGEEPASESMSQLVRMDEHRAIFHKASFLADLDFEQKNKLWKIGYSKRFGEDETILEYDAEPKGIYIVLSGSVSCYKPASGKEHYVDQMGESECFGELWLLVEMPTSVRFVASRETRVHIIEREAFNALLDKDGTLARKLYKGFTKRLLRKLLKQQNQQENRVAS